MTAPKNVAASVRQRLLNRARHEQRPFNELLQYYAMERFLYRLSQSEHSQKFILKGALMLRVWQSPEYRPTMDIDMLGKTRNDEAHLISHIIEILNVDVEHDGLRFESSTIKSERITEDADYAGIRIRFLGALDSAKVKIQLDIGFGDIVHPAPEISELPTMLDFSAPKLLCYSRESAIAEKCEAMVKLGVLNSRMKDFYDIWSLSRQFDFNGSPLVKAVALTFERRGTLLESDIIAFSDSFIDEKQIQWTAFHRRLALEYLPENFQDIVIQIASFLSPVIGAIRNQQSFNKTWTAPNGWN